MQRQPLAEFLANLARREQRQGAAEAVTSQQQLGASAVLVRVLVLVLVFVPRQHAQLAQHARHGLADAVVGAREARVDERLRRPAFRLWAAAQALDLTLREEDVGRDVGDAVNVGAAEGEDDAVASRRRVVGDPHLRLRTGGLAVDEGVPPEGGEVELVGTAVLVDHAAAP